MDAAADLLVKIGAGALICFALQVAGEAVGALIEVPTTLGARWLTTRWWAQQLYRRKTGWWLLILWVPAIAITWASFHTISTRTDWVSSLAIIMIFVVPLGTVAITGWWLRSPFRRRYQR